MVGLLRLARCIVSFGRIISHEKFAEVCFLALLLSGFAVPAGCSGIPRATWRSCSRTQKSIEVRRAAAFALKYNLQSSEVVQDLIDAFKDPDEIVRSNALDAVVMITVKFSVPPLNLALKSNDPLVKIQAARTLGRIKRYTDEAIPSLVFLLKDENYDVRQAAVEVLKRIQSSSGKSIESRLPAGG